MERYVKHVPELRTRLTIIVRRLEPIIVSDDGEYVRIESHDGDMIAINRNEALSYQHSQVHLPGRSSVKDWDISVNYIGYVYRGKGAIKRNSGMLYPYLVQSEYEGNTTMCNLLTYLFNKRSYNKLFEPIFRHGNMKFVDRCIAHIILTPDLNTSVMIVIKYPWELYIDSVARGTLGSKDAHLSPVEAVCAAHAVTSSASPPISLDDMSSDEDSAMSDDDELFAPPELLAPPEL